MNAEEWSAIENLREPSNILVSDESSQLCQELFARGRCLNQEGHRGGRSQRRILEHQEGAYFDVGHHLGEYTTATLID